MARATKGRLTSKERRGASRLFERSATCFPGGLTALRIRRHELPIQRLLLGWLTTLGIGLGAPESHAQPAEPEPARPAAKRKPRAKAGS